MAEIFLAKQSGMEGFEKLVVLKCILPALFDDEEFIEMFLDEARIAAKLNHPNIIQIYDLGRTDDTFYIAMEHVAGRNLQQLFSKNTIVSAPCPSHIRARFWPESVKDSITHIKKQIWMEHH